MIEKIKKMVAELLSENDNGHGYDHILRVLRLSLDFAKKEGGNEEVVSLIALLHEVDDYKLFGEKDAKELSNARKIMEDCHVDKNIQEQVIDAINNIGYGKRINGAYPTTIEGKIVSDADMCEALGVNGFLRAFVYGLKIGRPLFNRNVFPSKNVQADKYTSKYGSSTIIIVFEKLLNLKNMLLTNSGKAEAQKRHEIIVKMLYQYFDEEDADEWKIFLDNYLK